MRPEFKEAVKIVATGEYKCIPVSLELYADQYTPPVSYTHLDVYKRQNIWRPWMLIK